MSAIAKLLATSEATPPTSPDHVFDMCKSCLVSPSYCDLVLGSLRIFILECLTQAWYCKHHVTIRVLFIPGDTRMRVTSTYRAALL